MNSSSKVKSEYTLHNNVTLVRGGRPYFKALFELIDQAKTSIQLQVYILEEDSTGTDLANHLIVAANRGVKVQVLVDGYASRSLSSNFIKRMTNNNTQFRHFEPLLKCEKFYFGRRLHHKILVADGIYALVGGINISDRYNDTPESSAWLDWAIKVKGEAAYELHKICNQFYAKKETDKILLGENPPTEATEINSNIPVRIRRNDWVKNKNDISATYMQMFKSAKKEIIIMSSYFLPGSFFKKNILKALDRGVTVKLILAGISDIGISKYAEKYLYRWAIRHGIEIYEYNTNILHGKIAVCDNKFVTVGSYNINDISALASVELNLDINDEKFATNVTQTLTKIINKECIKINSNKNINKFSVIEQFLQWCSYELFRVTLTLFTFYFRKNKRNANII
jgi:cardiolipin synthase